MKTLLKHFERTIAIALIVMLSLVVLVATVELGVLIVRDLLAPPLLWIGINELLEIFGFFLLILIGVELMLTIRSYLTDHVVHAEIVLEVALIAIARKVIILEPDAYSSLTIIGIAALIIAIAAAYFMIKNKIVKIGSPTPGP